MQKRPGLISMRSKNKGNKVSGPRSSSCGIVQEREAVKQINYTKISTKLSLVPDFVNKTLLETFYLEIRSILLEL